MSDEWAVKSQDIESTGCSFVLGPYDIAYSTIVAYMAYYMDLYGKKQIEHFEP